MKQQFTRKEREVPEEEVFKYDGKVFKTEGDRKTYEYKQKGKGYMAQVSQKYHLDQKIKHKKWMDLLQDHDLKTNVKEEIIKAKFDAMETKVHQFELLGQNGEHNLNSVSMMEQADETRID